MTLSFCFCVCSPFFSGFCLWHPVCFCILMHYYIPLLLLLFSYLVHGRASPTLHALTHRQEILPYLAAPWSN